MKHWLTSFVILISIIVFLTSCSVQSKRQWIYHDELKWYDDSTLNVRCYQIIPWDGVSCIKK